MQSALKCFVCCVLGLVFPILHAQAPVEAANVSAADAANRLKGKSLFLRGMWRGDKLAFDGEGKLLGKADVQSFTLSSVQIDTVRLKKNKLEIAGHRYGLAFREGKLLRIALPYAPGSTEIEPIVVTVAIPQNNDYGPALTAIFADGLISVAPLLPELWRDIAAHGFKVPAKFDFLQVPHSAPNNDTTNPIPTQVKDPLFSDAARNLRYKGSVVVGMTVDSRGVPTDLRIERATGLGLDETAADAVAAYRFKPGQRNGIAVPVHVDVEVTFEVY